MTNNPNSVLQQHRELSHGFALVAPLGGGAILALQELQLTDRHSRAPIAARDPGRATSPGVGSLAAALISASIPSSRLPWKHATLKELAGSRRSWTFAKTRPNRLSQF